MLPILYLHGFASGPRSQKGLAVEAGFAPSGRAVRRLDLRVPSIEHLRASAMLEVVRDAIPGPVLLMGSSLGGLCAARVAEGRGGVPDERVGGLVLLAPAFDLARRWRERDPDAAARWEREGWLSVTDHTTNRPVAIDVGFLHDVEAVDAAPIVITAPTLVIHGVHDDTVDIASSRALAARCARVRLVEVDDGHELVASLPRILAETEAFLRELEG